MRRLLRVNPIMSESDPSKRSSLSMGSVTVETAGKQDSCCPPRPRHPSARLMEPEGIGSGGEVIKHRLITPQSAVVTGTVLTFPDVC